MQRNRPASSSEFREQIVELFREECTPEALARGFGPTAQTIYNRVKRADLGAGVRTDGLTTEERGELLRRRRENKQLEMKREFPKKAAARLGFRS